MNAGAVSAVLVLVVILHPAPNKCSAVRCSEQEKQTGNCNYPKRIFKRQTMEPYTPDKNNPFLIVAMDESDLEHAETTHGDQKKNKDKYALLNDNKKAIMEILKKPNKNKVLEKNNKNDTSVDGDSKNDGQFLIIIGENESDVNILPKDQKNNDGENMMIKNDTEVVNNGTKELKTSQKKQDWEVISNISISEADTVNSTAKYILPIDKNMNKKIQETPKVDLKRNRNTTKTSYGDRKKNNRYIPDTKYNKDTIRTKKNITKPSRTDRSVVGRRYRPKNIKEQSRNDRTKYMEKYVNNKDAIKTFLGNHKINYGRYMNVSAKETSKTDREKPVEKNINSNNTLVNNVIKKATNSTNIKNQITPKSEKYTAMKNTRGDRSVNEGNIINLVIRNDKGRNGRQNFFRRDFEKPVPTLNSGIHINVDRIDRNRREPFIIRVPDVEVDGPGQLPVDIDNDLDEQQTTYIANGPFLIQVDEDLINADLIQPEFDPSHKRGKKNAQQLRDQTARDIAEQLRDLARQREAQRRQDAADRARERDALRRQELAVKLQLEQQRRADELQAQQDARNSFGKGGGGQQDFRKSGGGSRRNSQVAYEEYDNYAYDGFYN